MPAQNLHLALLPYIKKHKASCAALCKAMREKKLSIHLYLDEYTGPNAAWSYCNNSDWHFLITSDGARLVSKFTWCGTYSFGSRGGAAKCKGVYEQTTGKKWEDLSEEARFLASQAVFAFKEALEIDLENDPQYWEAAEWLCQYDIEVEDFLTGNYDEGELFEENLDELNQLCAGMREIMDKYNSRLGRALKTALKNVLDLTPPASFPRLSTSASRGRPSSLRATWTATKRDRSKTSLRNSAARWSRTSPPRQHTSSAAAAWATPSKPR